MFIPGGDVDVVVIVKEEVVEGEEDGEEDSTEE
jgi:hypothetical protein